MKIDVLWYLVSGECLEKAGMRYSCASCVENYKQKPHTHRKQRSRSVLNINSNSNDYFILKAFESISNEISASRIQVEIQASAGKRKKHFWVSYSTIIIFSFTNFPVPYHMMEDTIYIQTAESKKSSCKR
jgi:hypothetical protein